MSHSKRDSVHSRFRRTPAGAPDATVWLVSLDGHAPIETCLTRLSPDERRRAERFRFDRDAHRYIVSHAALRSILSAFVGLPAAALRFCTGPFGKPALDPPTDLRFNLAHAGERALVGLAWRREIGVDIERLDPDRADEDVARHFFSAAELAAFLALPRFRRTAAFFRCWTRKESYIKHRGEGLSADLKRFDVSLDPGTARLIATRPDPRERSRVSLVDIDAGTHYAAALTIDGRCRRVKRHIVRHVRALF